MNEHASVSVCVCQFVGRMSTSMWVWMYVEVCMPAWLHACPYACMSVCAGVSKNGLVGESEMNNRPLAPHDSSIIFSGNSIA